jgi:hypothetical protein
MNTTAARKYASVPSVLCLLCFLLPFVSVSCNGRELRSFTGLQMATGTTVQEQPMFGPPRERNIDPEPLAIVALGCAIAGAVAAMLTRDVRPAVPAVAHGGVALSLLALQSKVAGEVGTLGRGMLAVEFEAGYWMAVLVALVACALHGYLHVNREPAAVPAPALDPGTSSALT